MIRASIGILREHNSAVAGGQGCLWGNLPRGQAAREPQTWGAQPPEAGVPSCLAAGLALGEAGAGSFSPQEP